MSARIKIRETKNSVPTLYLIATPIGNLGDITYRAIETLNKVDIIYAEDTRVTKKLLSHYGINKSLESYHMHNEKEKLSDIIKHLENGLNVGFCSDAGMPAISDPGYLLVSELKDRFNVVIIPGVSSVTTALAGSGLSTEHFTFIGFIEKKRTAKIKQFEKYKNIEHTLVFFESANRLEETLLIMYEIYGSRQCVIGRELTKLFETYYEFDLEQDLPTITLKGEFVILLEGVKLKNITDEQVLNLVTELINEGKTLKDAVQLTSNILDVNKNRVYDLAIKKEH